jgi:cytochrome c-type biogenesis protein CcmH
VQRSIDELNALRRAAEASPQDVRAWSRLGSAYLRLEEFQAAQRAYERANRMAQGRDADALAGLAETGLLGGAASGAMAAGTAERAAQQFEQVLLLDPGNGKALFYSAVIAMQSGNPALARQRFAALRASNVPPEVAAALDKQIATLDEQLKPAAVDAATAIRLTVRAGDAVRARIPAQAPLFVFVRGAAGGPPLAVRRLTTALPVELTLSAADSMIAGNGLKPGQAITVVARVSASGGPIAQSGDPYGEVSSIAGEKGLRTLTIDRLTP